MKFNIGAVSPKTYKHRYNSFNVTTCNPIFVQPTFFRFVMPNSKINCTFKQTLRTLPMPFPSFANVKICNKAFFVPIEDIFDGFSNMMSEKPYAGTYNTFVPKTLPYVSCTVLSDSIIKNSVLVTSKYFDNIAPSASSSLSAKGVAMPVVNYEEKFASVLDGVDVATFAPSAELPMSKYLDIRNKFVIDGVDYFDTERVQSILDTKRGVVPSSSRPLRAAASSTYTMDELDGYDYVNLYNSADTTNHIKSAQGIKFTANGAALIKILNGLGYKFTRQDDTKVNLMPLIAFYKCWFESFYPSRMNDFQSTAAGKLIIFFRENKVNFTQWNVALYADALSSFLLDLSQCFVSNPTDFASMHMQTINNVAAGGFMDITGLNPVPSLGKLDSTKIIDAGTGLDSSRVATLDTANNSTTAYDVKFLLWLQKYLNRDSIIGNRIDLWMRSHLNSDVYSRVVARSHILGYSEFNINIGDVDSTAQTSDLTQDQGAPLGAYAGKAVGSGDFHFKGSFNTYGFVFVLTWYECATDVTQCVDPQLFAINKWSIPQPELDCLGYEVTPKSAFFTDNGYSTKGIKKFSDNPINDTVGFGFVPRLSSFKTFRPVVNGDLARRSMLNSYLPFVNRRYLSNVDVNVDGTSYAVTTDNVPIASYKWRWQNAIPSIGGYDNIFAYNNWSAFQDWSSFYPSYLKSTSYKDNVILYTSIDLMEINALKPLSNSYDTDILKNDGELTVNNN